MRFFTVCILIVFMVDYSLEVGGQNSKISVKEINQQAEHRVETEHREDSLNLLIYFGLLTLTLITIWVFKHHRVRFLHETGLSLVYGLITGVIIRYGFLGKQKIKTEVRVAPSSLTSSNTPPEYLYLQACFYEQINCSESDLKYYYQYSFKNVFHSIKNNTWTPEGNAEELDKATFDPEIFFNILLPPIIFYAGYSMKRRHFFRNLGTILTYAFLGTAISTTVVGAIMYGFAQLSPSLSTFGFTDSLFFGALISATDPVTVLALFSDLNVDVDLYAMVFGESVLNDAVAIVLTTTIEAYSESDQSSFHFTALLQAMGRFITIFLGSFALGAAFGCLTSLITKYTQVKNFPLIESALFFVLSYSSFLAAEAAELTGIVAVLFCGICQAHYTYNNLSQDSKLRTRQLFELLNLLTENFVFIYIGVSIFTYKYHQWNVAFIAAAFVAIIIGRAFNIYPLSFLLNCGRSKKISWNIQHMLMLSGLRGAIAFALAIRNTETQNRKLMFSTTLIIVLVTIWIGGATTTQILSWLKIRVGVIEEGQEVVPKPSVSAASNANSETSTSRTPSDPQYEDLADGSSRFRYAKVEKAWLVLKWYKFDERYIKPLLTHSRPTLMETLPSNRCFQFIARYLTSVEQLQMGTRSGIVDEDSDTDDLIIDPSVSQMGRSSESIATIDENSVHLRPDIAKVSDVAILDGDLGLSDPTDRISNFQPASSPAFITVVTTDDPPTNAQAV